MSIFAMGAAISVTVICGLTIGGIQMLQEAGIVASIGRQTLTATWLAAAFSVATALVLLIEACCCCI